MTRKQWLLLAVAVLLGGFSVYLNKDWFGNENIQIFHRSRPPRGGRRRSDNSSINPIVFGCDAKLKLTELKVFALSDVRTNKYPHALWHLVSDSNSVPIKEFSYGAAIPGMRPFVKGLSPESLQPDVEYRLHVEAGAFKLDHDFIPTPRTP
jgi:hypothetical protein